VAGAQASLTTRSRCNIGRIALVLCGVGSGVGSGSGVQLIALWSPANVGPDRRGANDRSEPFLTRKEKRAIVLGAMTASGQMIWTTGPQPVLMISTIRP
jgi:hypothetical protein